MAKLRITQVKSQIGATKRQRATMHSLGLKRIRQSVEREDTPDVNGALRKVSHLVLIEKL